MIVVAIETGPKNWKKTMPADPKSKAAVEGVKATLEDYQEKIETRVKELVAEGKGESDKEVEVLREQQGKINESLTNVQQQLKTLGQGLPGLQEELDHGQKFSFQMAARAMNELRVPGKTPDKAWEGAEFEREVIDEYAKTRTGTAGDGSSGGYLIPPEVSTDIIGLVAAAIPLLDKLPITKIEGLHGDFHIPKLTGRPTGYWVGENEQPTASDATYGEIISRIRRVAGFTKQSKRLIYQSRGVSDQIIKRELATTMALKLHEGFLKGTGSNYQPKGLLNWSDDFTSNDVSIGSNGGRISFTDAELMKMALMTADEGNDNPANYGFLMRPEVVTGMKTERIVQYSGQSVSDGQPVMPTMPVIPDSTVKELLGNFATTTQIAATESKGTSSTLSKWIYGNWRYFWAMFWEGMEMRVGDQAFDGTHNAFTQNMLFIIAEQGVDCAVTRGAAFTQNAEAETTASNW